jgi:hypothetical protein
VALSCAVAVRVCWPSAWSDVVSGAVSSVADQLSPTTAVPTSL